MRHYNKMRTPKIFFTGKDNIGWALDEDLRLTLRSLQDVGISTSLADCDIIHSIWWESLLKIPNEQLSGKRILCHFSGEPARYLTLPKFNKILKIVGHWIPRSDQAYQECQNLGIPSTKIPYIVDTGIFRPLPDDSNDINFFKEKWSIPDDAYLIGNFNRDTEGHNLYSPKIVKGPDIFVEIVKNAYAHNNKIHVILAGPRRHWLRRRLTDIGIPYTFIGQEIDSDDINTNIISRDMLNILYNIIDLNLISSRSEGGPHSTMESAAAHCKTISTRVGHAADILDSTCIYDSATQAINMIIDDINNNTLSKGIGLSYNNIATKHTVLVARKKFQKLYNKIEIIPTYTAPEHKDSSPKPNIKSLFSSSVYRIFKRTPPLKVSLWHKFQPPPWGGANQFMIALRKHLIQKGVCIEENRFHNIDVHFLQAIWFNTDEFLKRKRLSKLKILHRIDGPVTLVRGSEENRKIDDLCFKLNLELATVTVLQSLWSYTQIKKMGYDPVNPVIIHNAVDPDIFHPHGRIQFDSSRKVRLISSSWSNNSRKGGPVYKWIEDHLDWNRFEYTFVGRASEEFTKIHQIDAVPSAQLAGILRKHDIYITASQNDPCSNALIEALACGLPTLYLNDGGHPELVGYGGLPFNNTDEILSQLDILVANYQLFQNLIVVPKLDDVADKYLEILLEIART